MSQEPGNTPPAPTRSFFKAPLDATNDNGNQNPAPPPAGGDEPPAPDPNGSPDPNDNGQQPKPGDHKNDPKRFEYWQSQAAKAQNQLTELSQQLEQYKSAPKEALELAQTLFKKPELLDILEKAQNGQLQALAPKPERPAKELYAELKRPQQPVKPADYDEYEAANDPESESYKYREAAASYKDNLTEYLVKREELRERMEEEEAEQKRMLEEEMRQQNELAQELEHKFNMPPEEVRDFFAVMSQAPSTEQLVRMYRALKAPAKPAAPPTPRPPAPAPPQDPAGGQQPKGGFFGSR